MNISLSQCEYVILFFSQSLFTLLFILKVSLLDLRRLAEKVKHSKATAEKKQRNYPHLMNYCAFCPIDQCHSEKKCAPLPVLL